MRKARTAVLAQLLLGTLPGMCAAAELPSVLVHVLDSHGRPLAGAVVHAAAEPEVPDLPEPVIEEKTGPDGTVRLSGLPDDRIVWVLAERRGYAPAFQSFSGAAGDWRERRERRIVLAPGSLAVGRVVDEKGRPVVGAEAELTGDAFGLTSASSLPAFLRARPKVRTGPAGRFRFRDLPAGRYELRLRHPAFSPLVAGHSVQGGRSGDLGRFVLHRGTVLTGTVTDPDGRPAAGLSLWVLAEFARPDEPPPPTAVTGADGTFAIPGLAPDRLALYSCGPGYHPETVTVHFLDEPVRLTVRPAATLRGRVLGPDGEPLTGASLYARRAGSISNDGFEVWTPCPENDEAVSDARGRFVVGPLAPGWYDLLADARGMKQAILPMLRTAAGEPGDEAEIRLEAGGILSGRVLDEAGAPIAGADLSFDGPWSEIAESARDGSFSFNIAFREPSSAVLSAEKCGYTKVRRELEDLAGDVEIDLVLAQDDGCSMIRGRVVGPDGAPVERALVTGAAYNAPAWTAADGAFELAGSESKIHITVEKPGFATVRREIDPAAGSLEFRLERGAVVSGRLLGLSAEDRSQPIQVILSRQDPSFLRAPVTGDATFRIENVPSGTWNLSAQAGALIATRTVTLEPGQAELSVDLDMPAAQTVSGQVLDDRAQPVAGATIMVKMTDGRDTWWLTDTSTRADGSFALRLPDESYFLDVSKDGFLPIDTALEVTVDGEAQTGLEIRLEPATTLRGRLFGLVPGDRPAIVMRGPGFLVGRVELERFVVEGLQPGEWTIEVSLYGPGGRRSLRRAVEIPPGITEMEADLDFAEAEP